MENQYKEGRVRPRVRVQGESKESQTTLIVRACKTRKLALPTDGDRRKANKSSGHEYCATYNSTDANCLPEEYRFSW